MRAAKSSVILAVLVLLGYGGVRIFSNRGGESARLKPSPKTEAPKEPQPVAPLEKNPVVATVGPLSIRLADVTDLSLTSESASENLKDSTDPNRHKSQIRRRYLEEMIHRRLLVLGSAKHPEWVSDASWEAEVQSRLVEIGPEEVERRRVLSGISKDEFFADFRKHVREEMMKSAILAREVHDKIAVTGEELEQRYAAERETTFYRPASWGIYRFTRSIPRKATPDPSENIAQVERLRAEIAGEIASATHPRGMALKMAEVLRDRLDPSSDEAGHAYVYDFEGADFDPALKSHLRSCVVGDLSPVFELAGDEEKTGYCFYLPYSFQPSEQAPFERVRHVLEGKIREERKNELTNQLFDRLKTEFPVEIRFELLDLDPPEQPTKENPL